MEVVTQFDPGVSKQLEDAKMECERCASSIKEVVEGETDPSETEPWENLIASGLAMDSWRILDPDMCCDVNADSFNRARY